jgi:hypothetical protein
MAKHDRQLAKVKNGKVEVIATTPGSRRIYLVSFGEREQTSVCSCDDVEYLGKKYNS